MFAVWLGLLAGMILLGAAVTVWLIGRGVRERRAFDWSVARYEGRHAVGQPREVPSSPPAAGHDPQPKASSHAAWYDSPSRTWNQRPFWPVTRSHVSAADLLPVAWTDFAVPAPAPAKHGTADTGRLPRIRLDTATTGEIRAVGAAAVEALERAGAADRAAIEKGESLA